jgi:hypothetical protein
VEAREEVLLGLGVLEAVLREAWEEGGDLQDEIK